MRGRMMLCQPASVVPIEAVVRGFLAGSGWKAYQSTGHVGGIRLPQGLRESDRLAEPIFTPATKAELGAHDENVDFAAVIDLVGAVRANQLQDRTLQIYTQAADHALTKGIIIADTKVEFGVDADGNLRLADEVFTPDSSRYWRADDYRQGVVQQSYDKQFVRNWLTSAESGWDRYGDQPPPALPQQIVDATRSRYIEAYERISGLRFADWIGSAA
jgi:phosphoribosylaminoimidazole-succinocarboxamide synthase